MKRRASIFVLILVLLAVGIVIRRQPQPESFSQDNPSRLNNRTQKIGGGPNLASQSPQSLAWSSSGWLDFFKKGGFKSIDPTGLYLDEKTILSRGVTEKELQIVTAAVWFACKEITHQIPTYGVTDGVFKLEYDGLEFDPHDLRILFSETRVHNEIKQKLGERYETLTPFVDGLFEAIKFEPMFRNFGREYMIVTFTRQQSKDGYPGWQMTERVESPEREVLLERTKWTPGIPYPYGLFKK